MDSHSSPDVGKLARALFEVGAVRFGRFTLSSGKASSYYLDLRMIPSFPEVYGAVVGAYGSMVDRLGAKNYDVVAGVATAGVTISSPLAFLLKKPMVYVRREEKGHGLGRQVEGALQPGWRAVVVDDLVTTGGSLISAAEGLRRSGCVVHDAVVLVDRLEGGGKNLGAVGITLHSYVSVKELVDVLFEAKKMTKKDRDAVMRQVGGGDR